MIGGGGKGGHAVPDVPTLAVEALDWLRGEAGPSRLPSNGALAPPLMSRLSSWPQDLGDGSVLKASRGKDTGSRMWLVSGLVESTRWPMAITLSATTKNNFK